MIEKKFTFGDRAFFDKDLEFRIYVDRFMTRSNVRFHSHVFYELVFIEKGFLVHYINNESCLLTPGDLFWILPGEVHGYSKPKQAEIINCIFQPEVVAEEMERIRVLPGIGSAFSNHERRSWQRIHLSPAESIHIVMRLDSMKKEIKEKKSGWELCVKSELLNIFVMISRNFESKDNVDEDKDKDNFCYNEYIYKAIDFIHDNYNKPLTLDKIAQHAGIKYDYFYRLFKRTAGITPLDYLKNYRMSKAAETLLKSSKSITDVLLASGFDNPAYFSKEFKKTFSVTPTEFRKLYRNQLI